MNFTLVSQPTERYELPGELVGALVPMGGVNWDREVALILDLGEKRTAGYALKVLSVDLAEPDQINLVLEVRAPGPGEMVAQVLTRPYAVCRLPRVGLRSGPVLVAALDPSGREIARQEVQL